MDLSTLRPHPGSKKRKIRVGRGEGSGVGKTSGRGGKGQTARSGGQVHIHFEGGQTPLYRRVPKVGFRSRRRVRGENQYEVINVSDLEKFEAGSTVDLEALRQIGRTAGSKQKAGIKLLGKGDLSKQLNVKVHAVSASARAKIEAVGGSVELV